MPTFFPRPLVRRRRIAAAALCLSVAACSTAESEPEQAVESASSSHIDDSHGVEQHNHGAVDVRAMTRTADLVFEGTVASVNYRTSSPARGAVTTPFTFVSYNVSRVLKGRVSGRQVTLRFEGGMQNDGRHVVHTSGMPLFDIGDRDILYVQGNLQRACPLVGCSSGRIRLIDSRVTDENGNELFADASGILYPGSYTDAPTLRRHQFARGVGIDVEFDTPPTAERSAQLEARGIPRLDPTMARSLASFAVAREHTREALRAMAPIPNADYRQPFTVPNRVLGPAAIDVMSRMVPDATDPSPRGRTSPVQTPRGATGSRYHD